MLLWTVRAMTSNLFRIDIRGVRIAAVSAALLGAVTTGRCDSQLVSDVNGLTPVPGFFLADAGTALTFSTSGYPALASIDERGFFSGEELGINRNDLVFSSNGGSTPRPFDNQEPFDIGVSVKLLAGQLDPSKQAGLRVEGLGIEGPTLDGIFYVDTATAEIIVLGSLLPYYSFTENFGATYTVGDEIRLRMKYTPPIFDGETLLSAGTIEYRADAGAQHFTSGSLEFTNPESGLVTGSTVGVYEQASGSPDHSDDFVTATFSDFDFNGELPNPDADFDNNGYVDGADAIVWQRGLGMQGASLHGSGDATFDEVIDGADLSSFALQFGEVTQQVNAVPEPNWLDSSIIALGIAFVRRGQLIPI